MIRLNNQDMQVFDGSSWLTVGASYASIDLDADTQSLLEWARKKRDEEMVIERLAETNPTIKDLVNQIKDKQEQLKIVQTLIQKEITS
jgi:lipid II:glycine glycyltransferase (peptidoglycan interpeptide bridge formation enzyme)